MSSQTPEVDVDRLAAAMDAGAQLVDVRERGEYAQVHVPGARLIPMGQLAARLDELDRSAPVYVICATGNRSKAMTDLLRAQGFDASSVAGGTQAWLSSGRAADSGL
ncbi:sulfurtransferase [Nocardioides sp. Root122]|uniref:rhodanese-like domain-containing protein n=1 Tax=Nocardioides TaxID=1839 RepID=UPI000702DD5C|nr:MULTISPECIES: rhodanese-like domain-containing protein [Nocardioides]KQV67769.1 sulfurtransferase [Nocardioides sp. Root122]MCK9823647.1 rhodanese-like domain-containing protein [Nocardioides cavernae]